MREVKWILLIVATAGIGFYLYKYFNRKSNDSIDNFAMGYMSDFSATQFPKSHKKYGEIATSIQEKQIQSYKKANQEYIKQQGVLH